MGLGASGYINRKRYTNTKNLKKYLKHQFIDEVEEVSKKDDINYQLMLNLRTKEGLSLKDFSNKFDINLLNEKKEEIDSFISQGLLVIQNNHLIPTYEGMMKLDSMLIKLFF